MIELQPTDKTDGTSPNVLIPILLALGYGCIVAISPLFILGLLNLSDLGANTFLGTSILSNGVFALGFALGIAMGIMPVKNNNWYSQPIIYCSLACYIVFALIFQIIMGKTGGSLGPQTIVEFIDGLVIAVCMAMWNDQIPKLHNSKAYLILAGSVLVAVVINLFSQFGKYEWFLMVYRVLIFASPVISAICFVIISYLTKSTGIQINNSQFHESSFDNAKVPMVTLGVFASIGFVMGVSWHIAPTGLISNSIFATAGIIITTLAFCIAAYLVYRKSTDIKFGIFIRLVIVVVTFGFVLVLLSVCGVLTAGSVWTMVFAAGMVLESEVFLLGWLQMAAYSFISTNLAWRRCSLFYGIGLVAGYVFCATCEVLAGNTVNFFLPAIWSAVIIMVMILVTILLPAAQSGIDMFMNGNLSSQETHAQRAARRCEEIAAEYSLTTREKDVLVLVASGCSRSEIADNLIISEATARTHLQNLYRKCGVHSAKELMGWIHEI
ncbi:MAG: response regulator transcription factor [Coriobacteriales bacterium]|nr:response regulator transcription factor [Coriobacteriales bacterium]